MYLVYHLCMVIIIFVVMQILTKLSNYNASNNEFQTNSLFWQRDLRWPQLLQYTSTLINTSWNQNLTEWSPILLFFYVLNGTKKYTVETLNFCKTWEWNLLISQYYPSLQSQGKDNLAIVMFHITASINSSITVSNETKKPLIFTVYTCMITQDSSVIYLH